MIDRNQENQEYVFSISTFKYFRCDTAAETQYHSIEMTHDRDLRGIDRKEMRDMNAFAVEMQLLELNLK